MPKPYPIPNPNGTALPVLIDLNREVWDCLVRLNAALREATPQRRDYLSNSPGDSYEARMAHREMSVQVEEWIDEAAVEQLYLHDREGAKA
jgi:hypothetical protein